ncbi:WD40/YVTN repeat-like-containing domain protein [Cordyceps fumosorosea ARSEF 2679]|uniref:WD40/YVTN repeat-like-containing domain protein n=1 Tax=Cordyceps fumosorosea (strain ARSEF 2679) TaxID=1081104 RepID=A0A167QIL1_CORFA|nr:WD40/YVTN repeat-like-containing domain protein [Cordyceps fumosorosea ARSEF 2679]OAA57672.1 WD40/YVTN repeat-like-containing domain protein [Cordyceps fumosorosea ARSEF 2679]
MPRSTTTPRIPSLLLAALLLLLLLAGSSTAAPRPPPPAVGHPFHALQSVPNGLALSPVITGLYANSSAAAQIAIHDVNGNPSWTWSAADVAAQADLPANLLACLQTPTAVPEAKWADGGRAVLAIYNAAAVMIRRAPGDASQDKRVLFGVCLQQGNMGNTHSLELVPDGKLAVATTTSQMDATIHVFNVSAGLQADPQPVQSLDKLPGVHGLVWDDRASLLWGSGSSSDPSGATPGVSSAPTLNGYRYTRGAFSTQPTYSHNVSAALLLSTEWSGTQYDGWWDGSHDMTGVPGRRQLLLSTDTDLHVFDIDSQTFASGAQVASNYLPGFMPVDSRVGSDGKSLPRSDIKSLSIDGNLNVLYVQAAWQGVTSYQINLLQDGKLQAGLTYPQELYRSRWFADTPTWPKARLPSS